MHMHRNRMILTLVVRGAFILLVAITASVAIVSWISADLPPHGYRRSIHAAVLIPLLISPPISFWVGMMNYRYYKLHCKVEWLAEHDEMTGLLNRRAFQLAASRLLDQQSDISLARPVILLLADIDHFKKVNDSLGHDAGDEAIKHVAQILTELSPDGVIIARLGGEEFAILANWTSLAETRSLAESACRSVERLPCGYHGTLIPLTVSIGVAIGSRAESVGQILRRADEQLYIAKRGGRNAYSIPAGIAA